MPNAQGIPIPCDILELTNTEPVVAQMVSLWQHGHVTWEQALMMSVMGMSQQVHALRNHAQVPALTQARVEELGGEIDRLRIIVANSTCSCDTGYSVNPMDHGEECHARASLHPKV